MRIQSSSRPEVAVGGDQLLPGRQQAGVIGLHDRGQQVDEFAVRVVHLGQFEGAGRRTR